MPKEVLERMTYYLNEYLLALLEENPNQFQKVYQGWVVPTLSPKLKECQKWRKRFHQIVRQYLMGLPVEPLLETHARLKYWVDWLTENAPEIFEEKPGSWKSWDEKIQVGFGNIILSSTYDLIIRGEQLAQIIDWTSTVNPDYLKCCWNTQLKLFLFAESDTYFAEDISLTYWLLTDNAEPECLRFSYSQEQRDAFKDKLQAISIELTELTVNATFIATEQSPLTKFLQGQMSAKDYVSSVPEVEI